MANINTALTRLLDIRTPVISAPMAGASGGALAAAVTAGGGFGFIAAGYDHVDKFKDEIGIARSSLGVHSSAPLPIGVGFIAWKLEEPNSATVELLTVALRNRVKAVWLAFGRDLGRHVKFIRNYDQRVADGHKTLIFVQLSLVEEALTAVNDWKVDVIVAQGIEAGGHGCASAPPLLTLVPSFLAALPQEGPPILAAGGLANGAHVAAFLTLGVSGVVMGTRFLLTPESLYTDGQRRALITAGCNSTERTTVFDRVRGTLGWPQDIDGRALSNQTVHDIDAGVPIEEVREKFLQGMERDDPDRMLVWAGTGVVLINEISRAADVVRELHRELVEYLRKSALTIY